MSFPPESAWVLLVYLTSNRLRWKDGNRAGRNSGDVRIIACIEDPEVIWKILTHLGETVTPIGTGLLPKSRAPPATGLLV